MDDTQRRINAILKELTVLVYPDEYTEMLQHELERLQYIKDKR